MTGLNKDDEEWKKLTEFYPLSDIASSNQIIGGEALESI